MSLDAKNLESVDSKVDKKSVDTSKTDFSKSFNQEQSKVEEIRTQEAENKKAEGDPDANLDLSLQYPGKEEVGKRLLDTVNLVKLVQDPKIKNALISTIKIAHDDFTTGDLNKTRAGLLFINDKLQQVSEKKEFKQAVFESFGSSKSFIDPEMADVSAINEARANLIKSNNLKVIPSFSNMKILDKRRGTTSDGQFVSVAKISADLSVSGSKGDVSKSVSTTIPSKKSDVRDALSDDKFMDAENSQENFKNTYASLSPEQQAKMKADLAQKFN